MARDVQRNRERRTRGGALKQLPWRNYRNPYKPIEVLQDEQIERIHDASLRILEVNGIEFLDAGARDRLKAAGCRCRVQAGFGCASTARWCMEHVAKAPSEVTLHARNPERSLIFGGNHINFGSVASAPNCLRSGPGPPARKFRRLLRSAAALPEPEHRAVHRRISGRARGYSRRRRAISTAHYAAITLDRPGLASL